MIKKNRTFIERSNNKLFLGALGCFVLCYIPWFLLGADSYILIHDNLDHEFVFLKVLIDSGVLLDFSTDAVLPNIMNGLPRIALRTGVNVTFLLFSLFAPAHAYILNHLLVHLIGFVGMYLFLKRYVMQNGFQFLTVSIALLFGLVSYYHTQYGISIAGQPLLLFAFLNILNDNDKWYDWAFIVFFPFYSFLVVTLPFFLPLLFILWVYKMRTTGEFSLKFVLATFLITFVNILVELPLLRGLFQSSFVSHRESWDYSLIFGEASFGQMLENFVGSFFVTQYHAGQLFTLPILALAIYVWFKTKRINRTETILLITITLICIWSSFNDWFIYQFQDQFIWLKTITIDRFFFLCPFLWLWLLGSIITRIDWTNKISKVISIGLIVVLTSSVLYFNKELVFNSKLILAGKIKEPTFRQFYANDLFDEIKEEINQPLSSFKIVSVGIFPNIAQYNGFYTLDSYQNNYLLSYKNQFREIIAGELEQDLSIKNYYDGWGSRAYIFTNELGRNYLVGKHSGLYIDDLKLNYTKLKNMGCEFMISSVPITDKNAPLQLRGVYENSKSFWQLYLYKVI